MTESRRHPGSVRQQAITRCALTKRHGVWAIACRSRLAMCSSALAVLASMSGIAGCRPLARPTPIPVTEAEALGRDLALSYETSVSMLDDAQMLIQTIGPLEDATLPPRLDVGLFRQVLMACLSDRVRMIGSAQRTARATAGESPTWLSDRPSFGGAMGCLPPHIDRMEAHVASLPPSDREWVIEQFMTVDTLRVLLRQHLAAELDDLNLVRAYAETETARLREVANENRALALTTDVPGRQRAQTESDFATLVPLLLALDEQLTLIADRVRQFDRARSQLFEETAQRVASIR